MTFFVPMRTSNFNFPDLFRTLVGLVLLVSSSVVGKDAHINIRTLDVENGLSTHVITSIAQDDIGYLWVGTDDGLHRYDGVNFRVHRNDPGDSLTLSDSRVSVLLANMVEHTPELWIGTRNGLNHLDLKTGIFTSYFHWADDGNSLSNSSITSLEESENGDLWIGTENGLNLLTVDNRRSGNFLKFLNAKPGDEPAGENFIRQITSGPAVGNNSQIWVGTQGGLKSLNYFDNGDMHISAYSFGENSSNSNQNDVRGIFIKRIKSEVFLYVGTEAGTLYKFDAFQPGIAPRKLWSFTGFVRDIEVDNFDRIWVATYGEGLFQFSENDNSFIIINSFEGHPELKNSLSNSNVSDIHIDKSGILWAATDNGLNAIVEPVYGFATLNHIPEELNSLAGPGIRSIYEDSKKRLWVGTVANGLTRLDRKTGIYKHFINQPDKPNSLSTNSITSILEDRFGNMWIGAWDGGVLRLNADDETFTQYEHDPKNPRSISDNIVQGLLEDKSGRIWINTGSGLSRYDHKSDSFYNYTHDPQRSESISDGDLQSKAIYLDRHNRLWLGSYGGGLNRLDLNTPDNLIPESASFTHYKEIIGNDQSVSNNLVISINGGQRNNRDVIWVGTFNGGLTCIELKTEAGAEVARYMRYGEAQGLADNVVFGIEEDRRHNLWLSTGEGLSRFDPNTEMFTNYYVEDGLPANSFFWGASHQSSSGEMFFGGTDGLLYFYPGGIIGRRLVSPNISITDVKLMNKSFNLRGQDYNNSDIKFDYAQNLLTIEWALFDFISPSKNHYFYKLDGLHDQWISSENKTSATFTNLPGGYYTFHVKGSNYNGIPSGQEASISFRVKPPIWRTLVFKIFMGLFILLAIYMTIKFRTKWIEGRNQSLREANEKLNVQILERQQAEDATRHSLEEKEVLLREIYHRTKNNMSVIISLLNLQAANIGEPKVTEMFDEIKGRIYAMSLVHEQLMKNKDLSVIDLNGYARQLVGNLIRSYRRVGARVVSRIDIRSVNVSIDTAVPLGLVINEIITNSMKYAFPDDRQGEITLEAKFKGEQLYICVCDDGIGFTPQEEENKQKSLGMRIIRTVVLDQLGGELKLTSDEGTRYEILLNDIELIRRV